MGKLFKIESQHNLIEAIGRNDQKTLKFLYHNNYGKVERYIVNNNGSTQDAKDIFQEAFLTVYQNVRANKFVPTNETALQGYLFTIAKNKWKDHFRKSRVKNTNRISEGLNATLASQDDVNIDGDDSQEKIDSTMDAFNHLGEECKEILTLYYFDKKTMREIASLQNLTEASARNKKYRCMQHLKSLAFKLVEEQKNE